MYLDQNIKLLSLFSAFLLMFLLEGGTSFYVWLDVFKGKEKGKKTGQKDEIIFFCFLGRKC